VTLLLSRRIKSSTPAYLARQCKRDIIGKQVIKTIEIIQSAHAHLGVGGHYGDVNLPPQASVCEWPPSGRDTPTFKTRMARLERAKGIEPSTYALGSWRLAYLRAKGCNMGSLISRILGWLVSAVGALFVVAKFVVDYTGRTTFFEDFEALRGRIKPVLEWLDRQPDLWFYGAQIGIVIVGLFIVFAPQIRLRLLPLKTPQNGVFVPSAHLGAMRRYTRNGRTGFVWPRG
jgi:hypothetical protein